MIKEGHKQGIAKRRQLLKEEKNDEYERFVISQMNWEQECRNNIRDFVYNGANLDQKVYKKSFESYMKDRVKVRQYEDELDSVREIDQHDVVELTRE